MEISMTRVEDRFKLIPAVVVILRKNDQILLLRRKNSGWHDGDFGMIGGGVDGNETIVEAAIREAQEEAGVILNKNDLSVVHVQHRKDDFFGETINFFVQAKTWQGEPQIMEPDKCKEMGWFSVWQLPEQVIPNIKTIIEAVDAGVFYSEYGWDREDINKE